MHAILNNLVKSLPAHQREPLAYLRDLRDADLVEADKDSLWVHDELGRRQIEVPGGLKERHYQYVAPLLNDDEKAVLALAVLENTMQAVPWDDWAIARTLLRQKYSNDTEADGEWLPDLIASKGFTALAAELKQALADYRKKVRPARLKLVVVETPHWDGRKLTFGGEQWTFRRDDGPVNQLLDESENIKWQYPVCLPGLARSQVSEAARYLREKTKDHIDWHAAKDGDFWWSLPKSR